MLTGRFAPSPTGPLHMGSLITALASFLDMKTRGGEWYLRIDDIDPPRALAGAEAAIIKSLNAHGLTSPHAIQYQSQHTQRYNDALADMQAGSFQCQCTRAQLKSHAIYPGTCRTLTLQGENLSTRFNVESQPPVSWQDHLAGSQTVDVAHDVGDFIVRRKDQLFAYNLATAVDDGYDFSHVLRGQDLMPTTPIQITLMQNLDLSVPQYTHIPLLRYAQGDKLSKQTHAPALENDSAAANLHAALHYLGFAPPNESNWRVEQWLDWAISCWDVSRIPDELPIFTGNTLLT